MVVMCPTSQLYETHEDEDVTSSSENTQDTINQ